MADNSKFVLRWMINNATAAHAAGKAESGVFNQGGFKWTAAFEKRLDNSTDADLFLRCDHSFSFHAENKCSKLIPEKSWNLLITPVFIYNGMPTMEFEIHIIHAERDEPIPDPGMFAAPNHKSNVILKIGEKKLHVYKEHLAFYSPVFDTLFFGDFVEKDKEEVEFKEVVYEEFVDLLHFIYHKSIISDRTVPHILKLADQFQMESILKQSECHLLQSNGFDVVKKLLYADQYRLTSLKNHCLESPDIIGKLKSSPDFDILSDGTKAAICSIMMKQT